MKSLAVFSYFLLMVSCTSVSPKGDVEKNATNIKTEKADSNEWDIEVFDTQYDTFLKSYAQPISSYSEDYLISKNRLLVSEWNSRYFSGVNPNFYEVSIDYHPETENYGKEFNYKLYQFFVYLNWRYGVRFQGILGADRRR